MVKHIQVLMMIINAFALGINIMKNTLVGIYCSAIGLSCFTIIYIYDSIKEIE